MNRKIAISLHLNANRFLLILVPVLLFSCSSIPEPLQFIVPLERYHFGNTVEPWILEGKGSESCTSRNISVGYLEFTDNGNLYDTSQLAVLLQQIEDLSAMSMTGMNVVIYVHGWHHNAKERDSDLVDFRQKAAQLGCLEGFNKRETLAIYVGWRGESIDIPLPLLSQINILTYYARKSAAEIVGRRGFSRAILDIERTVRNNDDNIMLVIGHSFGTAALLSGIQEIIRDRIVKSNECAINFRTQEQKCDELPRFGHGVYLFNPAIEANAFMSMRSYIATEEFLASQPKLLNIIATRSESLARTAFHIAQTVFTWFRWDDTDVVFDGDRHFDERELMTVSVGQFPPFWNGSISILDDNKDRGRELYHHIKGGCHSVMLPNNFDPGIARVADSFDAAQTISCVGSNAPEWEDWQAHPISGHFFSQLNDPIQMTVADWPSDGKFMKDHNAHLCPNPFAYIASAVMENQLAIINYEDTLNNINRSPDETVPAQCSADGVFDFGNCFNFYIQQFERFESNTQRCE